MYNYLEEKSLLILILVEEMSGKVFSDKKTHKGANMKSNESNYSILLVGMNKNFFLCKVIAIMVAMG